MASTAASTPRATPDLASSAAIPTSGIVFSDQAEMSADGAVTRVMPLDLPPERRHFSAQEFVRLMQRNFFYFHVSSVWFNVKLLRALGGFPPELRWQATCLRLTPPHSSKGRPTRRARSRIFASGSSRIR